MWFCVVPASLAGIGVRHDAMLATQTDQYFCANTWKFMLFCVRATTRDPWKMQLRPDPASPNPFELLRVGTKIRILEGHQMTTNMPPGTANIAQTLQIRCVSGHAHAPHANVPRSVSLPPSPNTANSCGFASLAGIGVRHGAMLMPQSGPAFNCQHVEIHAALRQGDPIEDTEIVTSIMRRNAKTL